MPNAELISSAISGALGGLHQDYSEQRKLKAQENLAQLRGEIQQMIAQMNTSSREKVAGQNNETKVEVAGIGAGSRERVAGTMSGASLMRVREKIKADAERAAMEEDGRNTRHVTASGNAIVGAETAADAESGRNTRWLTPSGNARLGAATTERGQTLNFQLGSDRNALTQRDQDMDFSLSFDRNNISRNRPRRTTPGDPQISFEPSPARDINLPAPPPTPPPPVVAPKPTGGGATPRAQVPVTPRAALPSTKALEAAAGAALTALGKPVTPRNLQIFIERNRDRLLQQIQGGGQ